MCYFKIEGEVSGIYVNRLSEEEYEVNVTEGGREDALIKLSRDEFDELVRGMSKMIN